MKTLDVTLPNDTDIRMVRIFDAPRHLVRRAMTEPALVKKWLGGQRSSVTEATCDLRVGGRYRQVFRNPDGSTFFFTGEFREVSPERIVHTELFNGEEPGSLVTMTLAEMHEKTMVTILMSFPSRPIRDMVVSTGMADGAGESYDALAALLPAL